MNIIDEVMKDMLDRKELGMRRYGKTLEPGDPKDGLQEAYEEAMDLCVYLKKELIERDHV